MKQPETRIILILLALVGILYCGSYVRLSLSGHYEPRAFGLLSGPDGQPILAPKAAVGYDWHPSMMVTNKKEISLRAYFYAPLLFIDRKLWHTKERMETFKYPVRPYFDHETLTYKTIDLK